MKRARRGLRWLPGLVMLACLEVHALDTTVSGRVMFGSVLRLESADPDLLTSLNAPLVGLVGHASGSNADDANLNFRRHHAVSTALKGTLDVAARQGDFSALVRVMGWYDGALAHTDRAWGNAPNGYTAGTPLSDNGTARLSQFRGVALLDAWLQQAVTLGGMRLTGRLGRQTLAWGDRAGVSGGLEALNARNLPAQRRAGVIPQETRVPAPMLFGRLELNPHATLEGYVAGRFQPTALDECGTFWAVSDYLAQGCNVVMSGLPVQNDRARVRTGTLLRRLPTPDVGDHDRGVALFWKMLDTDFGLHQARYTWRTPMPGLRRSTRAGLPVVPGDPDGKNMAFLTEYPENIALSAFTFAHKRAGTTLFGELSYRPRAPFMLSPGDVLPPFLSPTVPALLRAAANAVPPGGIFHGYDFYPVAQAQFGIQQDGHVGATPVTATVEVVGKHAAGLPDPAVRRYGRADLFGVGPVFGICVVTTSSRAHQCTQAGYVTSDAWGYRLRVEGRWPALAPQLAATATAIFNHDVQGWSGDFLLNQGRKTLNLALRFEYRQRYLAEIVWQPVWGGEYNPLTDRDTLALAVGVKF